MKLETMRKRLDKYRGIEVTYKGVTKLNLIWAGLTISLNQLLCNLDLRIFDIVKVGNVDGFSLVGLVVSVISGYFAYKQIQMSDVSSNDARQDNIRQEFLRLIKTVREEIYQEINETRSLSNKWDERIEFRLENTTEKISEVEKDVYAVNLELNKHMNLTIHPGAETKLNQLEILLYETIASIKFLKRDSEQSYLLARISRRLDAIEGAAKVKLAKDLSEAAMESRLDMEVT
ncbi:hypothetical protein FD723_40770 (plasmid) [Nostoc sp. C052]|uniref:hypothetical protein n=1 Tax=Nostoc sp. C052 TaxID=2576902 RepID=UPI0015C39FB4|nr:hypothetical protein [Nostoc sp. C052]QLE46549.1 hypothetical protein FD723_40770 [Nostoc sp. C052]